MKKIILIILIILCNINVFAQLNEKPLNSNEEKIEVIKRKTNAIHAFLSEHTRSYQLEDKTNIEFQTMNGISMYNMCTFYKSSMSKENVMERLKILMSKSAKFINNWHMKDGVLSAIYLAGSSKIIFLIRDFNDEYDSIISVIVIEFIE